MFDPRQHLGDTALYTLERRDRIFNRTFSATLLLNLKLPIPIRPGRHCPQLSFCKAEHVSEAERTRELIELRLIERDDRLIRHGRSEEHTSELQSLMRISYAVFCVKTKNQQHNTKMR